MNREDWKRVEKHLAYVGSRVDLKVDDYNVSLQLQRYKMRLDIMVFIDGCWKGSWIVNDCEERRRFMRPVAHHPKPYTRQQVKLLGKKWCDAQRARGTYTYWRPYWPSINALRRHFEAHNSSVALISEVTE